MRDLSRGMSTAGKRSEPCEGNDGRVQHAQEAVSVVGLEIRRPRPETRKKAEVRNPNKA